ncbi:hypothetical protein T03_16398, partial [Trichinella britovi]
LVSPSSTCIKYFKSHSGHVCHFAELIYARLYLFHWPFVTSVNMVTYFIHCVFVMKKEPFTLDFGKSHLLQRVDTYLS